MKLTAAVKDFFFLVNRAGFINQFSDERRELELKIAGLPPTATRRQRTEKVFSEISNRITRLETEGAADINAYTGEDRNIMEKVFLYELFYRYKDKFDQLIHEQIAAGDSPVKIPFYNEALSALVNRGFTEDVFKHYLALGFQIRRAFYFIDRNLTGSLSLIHI